MNPMQIKVATYGGAALLLWLLGRKAFASATTNQVSDPGRVTKTLDVVANVDSPYFGMTDAEIAALNRSSANPGVNPELRQLIDRSNAVIAADDRENGNTGGIGP